MKLKQINKALRCPTCKKYGLKPMPNDLGPPYDTSGSYAIATPIFNPDKPSLFECKNCYSKFVEIRK